MSPPIMPTRVLIVGSGGREHALAWKLANEPGVNAVFVMPGNYAATAQGRVQQIGGDIASAPFVVDAARRVAVELVVVGPEQPLAAGLVDLLLAAGVATFGPTAAAARIESSKAFCRDVASAAGIPIAHGRAFEAGDLGAAKAYAADLAAPGGGVVVKADGLAAGKGVTVCDTIDEADAAIAALDGPLVIEQRLVGREASVIAICDQREALALPVSRDYKRLHEGDEGPNTGGMGAYSPLPDLPDEAAEEIVDRFHRPILGELARRGTPFRGALYAGLMLTSNGPRLLEFNARFGDPETQVILPRLAIALGPLLLAAARDRLADAARALGLGAGRRLPSLPGATVGIVLASAGYPGELRPGERITSLDDTGRLPDAPNVLIFHSGTFHESPGIYLANGGRVLTVVGRGADLAAAREAAEGAADRITWPGQQRRHDIGAAAAAGAHA